MDVHACMSSTQRKANIDVDGPDNAVPMHKNVKKFDHLRFCIIPEAALAACICRVSSIPWMCRAQACSAVTIV